MLSILHETVMRIKQIINQMSVPAAIATAVTASASSPINPIDVLMGSVNSNPYFIGIMMLLLNLGGRFLSLEISKDQEKFLSQPAVRRFFLFAILFVATRNIIIAGGLAIIVIILLGYLFNENSDFCLWRSCISPIEENKPTQEGYQGLSAEEVMILKRLQDKQTAAKQTQGVEKKEDAKPLLPTASDMYSNAINMIRSF